MIGNEGCFLHALNVTRLRYPQSDIIIHELKCIIRVCSTTSVSRAGVGATNAISGKVTSIKDNVQ
jgi:hypothetical protein